MWRCKWAELRINEIQSQALKYARELAAYDQNKLSRVNQSTVEEFGSKSLAFSSQWYRKKAMKRRKRKRAEDTTDLASYMSHHSLFSYLGIKLVLCSCTSWCECFAFIPPPFPFLFIISDSFLLMSMLTCGFAENKRSNPDGNSTADDFGNTGNYLFCMFSAALKC